MNEPVNEPVVVPPPTSCPFNKNEPVIFTEPVNVWVSSKVLPKLDEPLSNNVDEDMIEMLNCLALTEPNTVKSDVIPKEPLITLTPWLTVSVSFTCKEPKEPVPSNLIEPVTTEFVVTTLSTDSIEPDFLK